MTNTMAIPRWLGLLPLTCMLLLAGCAAPRMAAEDPGPSPLLDPTHPAMTRSAPETFLVRFETTQGDFVVEARREWAPNGAQRFYNLVRNGYYDGVRFFRVVPGFVVQFGVHGDPDVAAAWRTARMPDDSVRVSNVRGSISFASGGPDTRTVQVFINLSDNSRLDASGFAPFARIMDGMDVVDRLYAGYGEGAPRGQGPDQARIQAEGEAYLASEFPLLDRVVRARVIEP